MSARSQYRHRSREIALQLIYQLDVRPSANIDEAIELYPSEGEPEGVFDYACELVRGVMDNMDAISDLLRENIIGWRPERMVAVDKVAISLALYEGIISKKVPIAVSISEAVELAKVFGTEESGRFVNGVLGRIVRKEESDSD
ncbi:MAG TPA: transcription antitermination factor NusB [Synergistaceae bacterium]|jgi:N utilization substance protein B|nr:transcription antitermination factor NusB [Synergistaceae bacterium]NLL40402.1 transcription antitermination factor NusB [Synergistaceae bacterium]HPX03058.1 transcription antitermination factor NusB [Synergistaceae bacterium]HQA54470.1 transcription antitermination factor NusB [Synergistaceae bacterium]